MRGFLVLCLVAVVAADKLGYNYQPLGHDVAIGGGAGLSGGSNSDSGSGVAHGLSNGGGGLARGGSSNPGNAPVNGPLPTEEYNKQFYTYSAPEEDFHDDGGATQRLANSLRKNLRVLFIRTPENNGLSEAALQLAQQASQDRTAIYVLQKQADVSDLAKRLQSLKASNGNKPEVHFVKYRTREDAVRAQQAIQAEYEALRGPSHSSDEGVAPLLNFDSESPEQYGDLRSAPKATNSAADEVADEKITKPSGNAYVPPPKTTYLPPSLRLK